MRAFAPPPVLNTEFLTGHFRRTNLTRSYREHGTSDWLLILTLDGGGRFVHADGTEAHAAPGDAVLIAPGTRHDYGPAREQGLWETLWAHFYPRRHWVELIDWPEEIPGFMRISIKEADVYRRVAERFAEAHALGHENLPRRDWFAMNALEEVLLWMIGQASDATSSPVDPRLRSLRQFCLANLSRKLTLDDLCEAASLSRTRVSQLFRTGFDQTPMQYIEEQRIAKAKELLVRTSLSIAEIATACGFENAFYFANRFRRHSGIPPTTWRSSKSP